MLNNEVHVYRADLNGLGAILPAVMQFLSPDEHERANRFRFGVHKQRFIFSRALLRLLLGAYLKQAPSDLQFSYSQHGKPSLLLPARGEQIEFNVSHSEDTALYAITLATQVGVDIERVRPWPDLDGIAERFFSAAELERYRQFATEDRPAAFYRCWTRKEAFIKAIGYGLAYPLDQFDVSLNEQAALLSVRGLEEKAAEWSLHDLTVGGPFIGALAVAGRGFRICEFNLLSENLNQLVP